MREGGLFEISPQLLYGRLSIDYTIANEQKSLRKLTPTALHLFQGHTKNLCIGFSQTLTSAYLNL